MDLGCGRPLFQVLQKLQKSASASISASDNRRWCRPRVLLWWTLRWRVAPRTTSPFQSSHAGYWGEDRHPVIHGQPLSSIATTCWPKRWRRAAFNLDIEHNATFPRVRGSDAPQRLPPSKSAPLPVGTVDKLCTKKGQLRLRGRRWRWCHLLVSPFVSTTHEQKEQWRKQTGRLRKSEFPQLRKHIRCTFKVQHCSSHGVLNRNAGSGSSGCISVRSCLSAAAANTSNASANAEPLVPRPRPGPLDHVQVSCRTPSPNEQTRVKMPKCEPGRRRPFRRMRKSWSFRLCGGLPRGVAVLGDRRPMLSCICTLARRIPRRPSNLTFVAVPHSRRKHLLQHISSISISTNRSMEPLGGRRCSATGNRRDLTRSCLGHLPPHRKQPAGTGTFDVAP